MFSNFPFKRSSNFAGFTLVELILYVTIASIFITTTILFAWDVIYGREKAYNQQVVDQSVRVAINRIGYEIMNSNDLVSVSPNQLVLQKDGVDTTIILSSGRLQISEDGAGPYYLTSNQVEVTQLNFIDLSSADNTSKNIQIELEIGQLKPAVGGQDKATISTKSSFELNGQFNDSRKLLPDLTLAGMQSAGTSLEGITIQNSSGTDVVIDKVYLEWSGTAGGESVLEIQMNGETVEFSGSEPSGTIVDIADYALSPADGVVNLDYILFDSDMAGGNLIIGFVMGDGSMHKSKFDLVDLGGSVTDTPTPTPTSTLTPTPTPTPTPSGSSCTTTCIFGGYSGGVCRKNARDCDVNGETYEPTGDQYCTGGPQVDTCCCFP